MHSLRCLFAPSENELADSEGPADEDRHEHGAAIRAKVAVLEQVFKTRIQP
jgi:hypothetical protein